VKYLIGFLILLISFLNCRIVVAQDEEGRFLAIAPSPSVIVQVSPRAEIYHLRFSTSISKTQGVTLRQQDILGDSLKSILNPTQIASGTPDARFKPPIQPFTVGEVFTIPTPAKLVSF